MAYIVLFILGIILILLSAFSQSHHYLTWAFGVWGVTLVIWYIVEKLYANFTMPKTTEQKPLNTDLPEIILDNLID